MKHLPAHLRADKLREHMHTHHGVDPDRDWDERVVSLHAFRKMHHDIDHDEGVMTIAHAHGEVDA